MTPTTLNQLLDEGTNVTLMISANDLRAFAENVASNTSRVIVDETVAAIRTVMGDKMRYCTADEAMDILGISKATLNRRIKEKIIIPCKVGARNLYLREEILSLKENR